MIDMAVRDDLPLALVMQIEGRCRSDGIDSVYVLMSDVINENRETRHATIFNMTSHPGMAMGQTDRFKVADRVKVSTVLGWNLASDLSHVVPRDDAKQA